MSFTLTCPECRALLKFKKPVIDSTKVKCSACKAKFYAGKSKKPMAAVAGGVAESDPAAAPLVEPAPLVEAEPAPAARPKRIRIKKVEQKPLPKWVIPVAVAGLVGITLAGIYFGQKNPPPPEIAPVSLAELQAQRPAGNSKAFLRPTRPAVGTDAFLVDVSQARRPDELVGTWEVLDGKPCTLQLEKDGLVRVRGEFLDTGPALDFSTTWFLMKTDGVSYDLEFGPEPLRASNHRVSFRLESNGQLRLLKYAHGTNLSVAPRVLKKQAPPQ
ncbi:MAG: hypothetical protein K1X57_06845 [Gemmataceae bacterium]|nr:hypothetical protein [Gemmataceae bacterium]